jgi:cytochrome P450
MADSAAAEIESEKGRLVKYLADGQHVITAYDEALEVMRHAKMRCEDLDETRSPFFSGTIHDLSGNEHVVRRRTMNRLVRPDALERYREEITMKTLLNKLRRLEETPDADGNYRVDLIKFSIGVFVQVAAAILGVEASTEKTGSDLARLVDAMEKAIHAKMTHGDARSTLADGRSEVVDGLNAKESFRDTYLRPALDRCPVDHGGIRKAETANLVQLIANDADPAWADADLRVRESVSFLIATVQTSSNSVTNSVDELHKWLIQHPEDRALTGDLDFLALVVQETLRFRPPSLPFFERQAMEDMVLSSSGRIVKKDDFLAVIMRSVNLDTEVFGEDAAEFNPRRPLPPGVPRYGIAFGAGQHQCLGLRVVLGNDGVGSQAHVLKTYLEAGIAPDPDHPPVWQPGDRIKFLTYPVLFTNLQAVTK